MIVISINAIHNPKRKIMNCSESYYTSGNYWQKYSHSESSYKVNLLIGAAEKAGLSFQEGFQGIEVGCGNGAFLIPLEQTLKKSLNHFHLTGYDISSNGIALAEKQVAKYSNTCLSFEVGSAADIHKKVDYIFLMDVLEHVENPYKFLRELRNKANYIFLHLPLENSLAHIVLGRLRRSYESFHHLHFFSWDSARIMLEECGYKLIAHQFTGGCRASLDIHGTLSTKVLRHARFMAYHFLPNVTVAMAGGSVMIVIEAEDDSLSR